MSVAMPRAVTKASPFVMYNTERLDEQKAVVKKITVSAKDAVDTVVSAVTAPFDIVVWLKSNWQLCIVGVVALLVILKD